MLPGRAEAKLDLRLVPDMTKDEVVSKLKAHLAKRGFGDIVVNVSGGYGPTETDENSLLIKARRATLKQAGIEYTLYPRARRALAGRGLHRAAAEAARGRLRHWDAAAAPMRRTNGMLIDSKQPEGRRASTKRRCSTSTILYEVARDGEGQRASCG